MNKAIEAEIEERTPKGWYGLASPSAWDSIVEELHTGIMKLYPNYEVFQIKEKFGGLRYYCSVDGDPQVEDLIRAAEVQSYKTCQRCGLDARTIEIRGWTETVCTTCEPSSSNG